MPKNIKTFCIIFISLFVIFLPTVILAGDYGLNETAGQAFIGNPQAREKDLQSGGIITSLPSAIGKFVGAGLAFIGVVFLVLMIYGGFVWMIARGNEQEVEKAKNLIEAAVIGLVIVMSAYAITAYIGGAIT
ncbi:hypothetical protein A2331_01980 [Candidatus Falkowbacteria bacterium RIFOXYB2_FULL_34_18]|uniref:Uncharacterized protein n=1 Tax=Candidatus Falkowbacteria bacterium RIFOXYD2_FULL_34_120 TaxID=1798007 RepID=A0A1F5TQP7_9BACT|nr:MAG: hypothetical protein A2331_01980 [Candidatus Falkowbacteria bacterium RIFOXYB2_FULL_34_18]OGF29449.1 MAG: hypothetical protein A2500_01040 [Candidatus Falkowbacteria bacterium RIFOXYC12_FULL_34_55]OGF36762.1 MAG: hypothetical protein A2466_03350 [Candidatus Falkowbacteria bacterium RIFOXYC2_FULL_34_220]OGF38975.1 MAG: hypothetical protein A2515_05465 [Candidatus Falkowbacteria bacterium RIFOXYD12_FULL_34_57]OGF41168.1 MAG: hypothetical protein A2531_01470 [Candidatus Falkowbacteria bact